MHDIARFITGFKKFQQRYFCDDSSLFDELKDGQHPKTLVVACIDSRVDPAILTGSSPGDLLVVRNVANLVPPYEPEGGHHGVSAALEHGVTKLEVEHVIVLGHSCCGGIQALLAPRDEHGDHTEFLGKWVGIAEHARTQTLRELTHKTPEQQHRACEQAAILISLENLLTFPWIKERVETGRLFLHGWYFDMQRGELSSYLPESASFEPLAPRCR
ncbi:MAG: carbonic anhydrase [Desulfovibrionaceae bacterium]|jgi:carbonic anhydrase|nr:carbonic anhydrase [Desulfovibrionaceae bacterium]